MISDHTAKKKTKKIHYFHNRLCPNLYVPRAVWLCACVWKSEKSGRQFRNQFSMAVRISKPIWWKWKEKQRIFNFEILFFSKFALTTRIRNVEMLTNFHWASFMNEWFVIGYNAVIIIFITTEILIFFLLLLCRTKFYFKNRKPIYFWNKSRSSWFICIWIHD